MHVRRYIIDLHRNYTTAFRAIESDVDALEAALLNATAAAAGQARAKESEQKKTKET